MVSTGYGNVLYQIVGRLTICLKDKPSYFIIFPPSQRNRGMRVLELPFICPSYEDVPDENQLGDGGHLELCICILSETGCFCSLPGNPLHCLLKYSKPGVITFLSIQILCLLYYLEVVGAVIIF